MKSAGWLCQRLCGEGPPQATSTTPQGLKGVYDFVVVGGGSAGCVVASRLSEDPSVSVLLIEAGPSNQVFDVRSPALGIARLQNSARDWAFRTEPQAETEGRVSHWPRGKTLGGCSSINYMVWVRGDPRNFDQWAEEYGCDGWAYRDVLPFFQKCEDYVGTSGADGFRGSGGPVDVTNTKDGDFLTKEVSERFVASCAAAGLPENADYNGPVQAGAALQQSSVRHGVRSDTASAYLFRNGAVDRPNLTVLTGHSATRLTFQGSQVTGVCLRHDDAVRGGGAPPPELCVRARREVVMSAGAVCTPWLLMLSGVGPSEHLKEHGIPVVADLPVGQHLEDHLMVPVTHGCKPGCESLFWCDQDIRQTLRLLADYVRGKNQLCYPLTTALAFARSGLHPEKDGNDMQLHFMPVVPHKPQQSAELYGLPPRPDRPVSDPMTHPSHGVTILATLVRPKSVGRISLRSSDPSVYPKVDPKYFQDDSDMKVLVETLRLARQVATSGPLGEVLGEPLVDETIPHPYDSDAYMEEMIRRNVLTVYHPVGTARMGRDDDPTAVVTPRLLVRGLSGLRVADASVMPAVPSGNTNAPSIMIGERAADFIKKDWALKSASSGTLLATFRARELGPGLKS